MMKNNQTLSKVAIWLSAAAAVLAAIVSVMQVSLWLAGTQWMLVAVILAIYAIYLNCCCTCGTNKSE